MIINMKKQIKAEIIADSMSPNGVRLTTFLLSFPRIVLAEFNTHRALDRNSASSRAIPYKKMLKLVKEDPFIPIKFLKDHKGMQGYEEVTGWKASLIKFSWLRARDFAVLTSRCLNKLGLSKQFCNRLLEPFMWHTVIATATDWQNFFALRAHEAAEIHIQDLAYKMLDEYNASSPKDINEGGWHIPFGDKLDDIRLAKVAHEEGITEDEAAIRVAVARCARLSYLNFEGKDDYPSDLLLHDRLADMGHWSPFGHVARVDDKAPVSNLRGDWFQYRKSFQNENKTDKRVVEK